ARRELRVLLRLAAAVAADQPFDLGVLALHRAQLRREGVGLLVDGAQARLLLARQGLQGAHVGLGAPELVRVNTDGGQKGEDDAGERRPRVLAREGDPVHRIAGRRDDLEQERLGVHVAAARALSIAASSSSEGSCAVLKPCTALPYVRVSSRDQMLLITTPSPSRLTSASAYERSDPTSLKAL